MSYRINVSGCQQIAFTSSGSTACTNTLNAKEVVVYSTADCFVNIAASPTAGTTGAANVFVPANTFLELDTTLNVQEKIAARGTSSSGTLYINTIIK